MKKVALIISIIVCAVGCENVSDNNNTYKIELGKEPYNICGEDIYFSNDAYGNELNIDRIVETIIETCNVYRVENAKEVIEDILEDDSYTREEIMYHLRDAYNYLDN